MQCRWLLQTETGPGLEPRRIIQEGDETMEFIVEGKPQGKARPRFSCKSGAVYTPSKTMKYEKTIREAFDRANYEELIDYDPSGYIFIRIDAYFPIPKSWTKKKKADALAGDIYPTGKPDIDNIQKAVLDALNGSAYDDDKQVVKIVCTKRYALHGLVKVWIGDFKP